MVPIPPETLKFPASGNSRNWEPLIYRQLHFNNCLPGHLG